MLLLFGPMFKEIWFKLFEPFVFFLGNLDKSLSILRSLQNTVLVPPHDQKGDWQFYWNCNMLNNTSPLVETCFYPWAVFCPWALQLAFLSDMLQVCHRWVGPPCKCRAFHLPTLYPNTNVSVNPTVRNLKSLGPQESKENLQQPTTGQKKTQNFQCDSGATRNAPSGKAPASSGQRHCTPTLTCLTLSPVLLAVTFGGRLPCLSFLKLLIWEDSPFSCTVWLDKRLSEHGTKNWFGCYLSFLFLWHFASYALPVWCLICPRLFCFLGGSLVNV